MFYFYLACIFILLTILHLSPWDFLCIKKISGSCASSIFFIILGFALLPFLQVCSSFFYSLFTLSCGVLICLWCSLLCFFAFSFVSSFSFTTVYFLFFQSFWFALTLSCGASWTCGFSFLDSVQALFSVVSSVFLCFP